MRIAIAQMSTRAADLEGTAERMVAQSRRAAEQGVDLLVFPAPALCGVSPMPRPDREGFLLDLAGCLLGLAGDLACPCVVPVLADLDGAPVPEAMLVADGSVTPLRLMAYLSASGSGEQEASPLPEVEFAGARLGVAFTYDDLDDYDDYEYDVDVILFLSGYGFAVDDPSSALGSSLTEGRFPADAEATGAWIVGVGGLGCYDGQVFCGSSFVLAPWGELAAQAPSLEEVLLVCDVDPSAEGPLADPLAPEVYDAPLMTWEALASALATLCEGSEGACLVVDGSLGSLVTAALATDALGPLRVRALVSLTGNPALDEASLSLVRSLRLPAENVEHFEPEPGVDPALARDLAEARLADLARRTHAVPLGSVDKTSLALEPFDGVCAARVAPLADLYRSDIVALTRLRNTISPVIPSGAGACAVRPAVEGLEEVASTDGARLEFVDLVLSSYVEWELPLSDVVAERGHGEVVERIVERLRSVVPGGAFRGQPIMMSSKTLVESMPPRGVAWKDRVRAEGERVAERAADALARIRDAAASDTSDQGAPSEEPAATVPSPRDHERDVNDLLGYLRDFSLGGGFSPLGEEHREGRGPEAGGDGGERGPHPLWEGPFSEN